MNFFRNTALPIFLAGGWISLSEFLRNELIAKTYWVEHYQSLGLTFPSEPINGAFWILWSLLFAAAVFMLSQRFSLLETTLLAWYVGFILMWVVVWNLNVLPLDLLLIAVPLSLLESFLAAWIIHKLSRAPSGSYRHKSLAG
jgi:hypothetical protein